jgi:hypothetical protein
MKFTDDKNTFKLAKAASLGPETPGNNDNGEVTKPTGFSKPELWMNSPSESLGEGIKKTTVNILYSFINSPVTLFTGKSLGGTPAIPDDRMNAFIDVVPGSVFKGLSAVDEIVDVGKGLQGYNDFVKQVPSVKVTEGLPSGMTWQERAGQLFQRNKMNLRGLKDYRNARRATTVITETNDELKKN